MSEIQERPKEDISDSDAFQGCYEQWIWHLEVRAVEIVEEPNDLAKLNDTICNDALGLQVYKYKIF